MVISAIARPTRIDRSHEQIEKTLLERCDPLIDLGLACYGANTYVVSALYKRAIAVTDSPAEACYHKGLRVGCLSNQSVKAQHALSHFPTDLIGPEETQLILAEADWDEAEALICNPSIDENLLEALYERTTPFSEFDEERWARLVNLSKNNARLTTREDTDDSPDMGHRSIHKAVFRLLEIAPVNLLWLRILYSLLEQLDPQQVATPDKIDHVLSRWAAIDRDSDGYCTSLSIKDEFRCLVAAIYGRGFVQNKTIIHGSLRSPDVALRCAYYGKARLTSKEMKEGHKRDENVYTFAVLFNENVYLQRELRQLLEDEQLIGFLARYLKRCDQIHKRRPHFDSQPLSEALRDIEETEQQPVTRIEALAVATDRKTADIAKQIQRLKEWVLLAVVILVILILLRT